MVYTAYKYKRLQDINFLKEKLKYCTLREIATEVGCSYSGLRHAIVRNGLLIPNRRKHNMPEDFSERIKKGLYKKYPQGRFGKLASNWRGGRRLANSQGYICIYKPEHPNATKDRYVMEHRLVAEKHLGRFLKKDEIVHHLDGDKQNNKWGNLKVIKKVDHVREHFKAVQEVKRLQKILKEHEIRFA